MNRARGTAAAAAVITAGLATACAGPAVTMNGTLTVTTVSGAGSLCQDESFAAAQGTQVTVVSPSGTVIGTGALGAASETASDTFGCITDTEVFRFRIPGLPSEPRYGVQVAGEQGTTWFTPQQAGHADLSLG